MLKNIKQRQIYKNNRITKNLQLTNVWKTKSERTPPPKVKKKKPGGKIKIQSVKGNREKEEWFPPGYLPLSLSPIKTDQLNPPVKSINP